jgi:hypothetical protein
MGLCQHIGIGSIEKIAGAAGKRIRPLNRATIGEKET